jgi:UDP-N-acetylglucosamine 4,6-dehydratase
MSQKKKGKMTITDKRMTRFWITLDQAVQLMLNAIEHMQGGEIFLPKIPSMKIMDLTKAIAPECEVDIIGIRPGEKIHEVLITEEEGRHTIDYDGMYVVMPNYYWWNRQNYKTGTKLPEGFTYMSNTNDQWLSVRDLKEIIKNCRNLFDDSKPSVSADHRSHDVLGNRKMNAEINSAVSIKNKHRFAN